MAVILPLRDDSLPALATEASAVLRRGGVLGVPTESVYGLAAAYDSAIGVRRVGAIKGRPDGKPLLVLIGHRRQLTSLVPIVSITARILMDHFWPGPLTLIMPAVPGLPQELTAGTGTIAVRHVGQPTLARLLEVIGPVTGTSANRSGEPPTTTAEELNRLLGHDLDLIADGGPAPAIVPSTLVDTREPVKIVREGSIGRAEIVTVLEASGIVVT